MVDDPLSEGMLAGRFSPGDTVVADVNGDSQEITLTVVASIPPDGDLADQLLAPELLEPVLE
jgi:hypothetical protein